MKFFFNVFYLNIELRVVKGGGREGRGRDLKIN